MKEEYITDGKIFFNNNAETDRLRHMKRFWLIVFNAGCLNFSIMQPLDVLSLAIFLMCCLWLQKCTTDKLSIVVAPV